MTIKENILRYVNNEDVKEKLVSSIMLENGALEQDMDVIKELDSDILGTPYMALSSRAFMEMDENPGNVPPLDICIPYTHSVTGHPYVLMYTDYLNSYFYGHKVLLVKNIKYTLINGEVKILVEDKMNFNPIVFNPEHHGIRLSSILCEELDVKESPEVEIVSTVIAGINSVTAPFCFMLMAELVHGVNDAQTLRIPDYKDIVSKSCDTMTYEATKILLNHFVDSSKVIYENKL